MLPRANNPSEVIGQVVWFFTKSNILLNFASVDDLESRKTDLDQKIVIGLARQIIVFLFSLEVHKM